MSIISKLTNSAARALLPGSVYAARETGEPGSQNHCTVYLTFDDGPHPDYTPTILDGLAEMDAKATFFVVGENAERYPDVVHRAHKEGHAIGTHSWGHRNVGDVSSSTWLADARKGRQVVEDIVGAPCPLFRPPFGDLSPTTLLSLIRAHNRVVMWSKDTKDFEKRSLGQLETWFSRNRPRNGDIVLLHDNQPNTSENLALASASWKNTVIFRALPNRVNRAP